MVSSKPFSSARKFELAGDQKRVSSVSSRLEDPIGESRVFCIEIRTGLHLISVVIIVTEETAHIDVLLLLLFGLSWSSSSGRASTTSGGARSSAHGSKLAETLSNELMEWLIANFLDKSFNLFTIWGAAGISEEFLNISSGWLLIATENEKGICSEVFHFRLEYEIL